MKSTVRSHFFPSSSKKSTEYGAGTSEVNNIENDFNELDNNIPLNPPLYPNKIIPENIINSAKKLKLIILQSKYLTEGKEYIINAGGLLGSKRKAKDGITFFGDKSVRI